MSNCNLRQKLVRRLAVFSLVAVIAMGAAGMAHAINLVQDFYVPLPESQIYQANNAIISGTSSSILSTISIVVTGDGTVIYYDQWEDGYETNLANPTQSTTLKWGDGNDADGIPPGFTHNPLGLTNGTVITLTNVVTQPRNPSTILWDARDHIAANKALVITRANWPVSPGPVFAGSVSVLSTIDYGTNYISPVGQNLTNNLFKYVGMSIMAAQNNTAVTIDPTGTNGVGLTNIVLNQGESYLVNGGIQVGARVTSTKGIQADLIIGHVGASYASDWFTLYPVAEWSSSYYTPVGSAATVSQPAYVYLCNPNTNAITINYSTKVGSSTFSVPGSNGVYQFQMPVSSGASFTCPNGQDFYALCTVAANNSSDTPYNWGFTLVPQTVLTTQLRVGWGPGSADGTVDGSPVWVTPLTNTTVYVNYHNDQSGQSGTIYDANSNLCDAKFSVSTLQSLKIYDPSKNQTGMKVYTCDGTLLTGAWGEDPDVAAPGNPYIDAGTTVIPFPVPTLTKSAVIVTDVPPSGLSVGDTILYSVRVDNKGLLPLGNTVVIDAPSGNLTYLNNSTTYNSNSIPDNGTNFPLASPGYTIPIILSQGTSTFQYLAKVNAGGAISNSVNIGGTTISSQAYIPPPPTNGASVSLTFSTGGGVPTNTYVAGASVYVTMTNAVGNTSSNTVQTINVTVIDTNTGDLETIPLVETGINTGVFRNTNGLPTSTSSGVGTQNGILYVMPGDIIGVSYTDPTYGDSASANAAISIPTPKKQLYLSETNALTRINPSAPPVSGTTYNSVDIGSGVGSGSGVIGLETETNVSVVSSAFITNSLTIGAGANQLILVSASSRQNYATNVTCGGAGLNLLGSSTNSTGTSYVSTWWLTGSFSGKTNVVVQLNGSPTDGAVVGVAVFTNVNQSSPLGTYVSTNSTTGHPVLIVPSGTNQMVYDNLEWDDQTVTNIPGPGQAVLWNVIVSSTKVTGSSSISNNAAGVANITMSWTNSGAYYWTYGGVSIKPAAAGVAGGPSTNEASFVQTLPFQLPFTVAGGGAVVITNFITVTNGAANLAANTSLITAALQTNGVSFLTLTNPTYTAASGGTNLVWTATVPSQINIPSGTNITFVISNGVPNSAFHVNYGSTNAPSVIVLPTTTVINIVSNGVFDAPYPGGEPGQFTGSWLDGLYPYRRQRSLRLL